jgi:hypothetical protein
LNAHCSTTDHINSEAVAFTAPSCDYSNGNPFRETIDVFIEGRSSEISLNALHVL